MKNEISISNGATEMFSCPADCITETPSLRSLCEEFLSSRVNNSESTRRTYERLIRNYVAPYYDLFRNTDDITMHRLGYIVIMPILNRGHHSTASAVTSILIMIMNYATVTHENVCFRNIKNLPKVVNMKKKDEYEIPQKALVNKNIGKNIKYIFKVFSERHPNNKQVQNLLLLSFYLCLRQSEILSIRVRDINFKRRNLHIVKTKTIKKGGFDIPICPILEELLKEIISTGSGNPDDYIFTNRNNRRLHTSTLECYMYKTDLRGVQTAHGIRAIFSTWASRNNKDSLTSECILTHKNWSRVQELYNRDLKTYLYNKRKKLMSEWIEYVHNLVITESDGT